MWKSMSEASTKTKPGWRGIIRRSRVVMAALFILAALYLGRVPILRAISNWLDIGEAPRTVDYALVLPGNEAGRPFVAAAMLRAGLAEKALILKTEKSADVEDGTRIPPHEVAWRVLRKRGVISERIVLLESQSTSTYTDAVAMRDFLEQTPPTSMAVVTDDFHTRRSRWIFRRVLADRRDDLSFVSVPTDNFSKDNWWRSKDGFIIYALEYGKFAYAFVSHGTPADWGILLAVLAGLVALCWAIRRLRKPRC